MQKLSGFKKTNSKLAYKRRINPPRNFVFIQLVLGYFPKRKQKVIKYKVNQLLY